MSPEEEAWLESAVAEGLPIRRMADALARSPSTIRRWIEKHPVLRRNRLEYELRTWAEISGSKDWRAKAWILIRLAPGAYNEIDAIKNALKELAKESGMNLEDMVAVVAAAKARADAEQEAPGG